MIGSKVMASDVDGGLAHAWLTGAVVMTLNAKTQKMQISVFVQNCKKPKMEIFAFCVINFEPIRF